MKGSVSGDVLYRVWTHAPGRKKINILLTSGLELISASTASFPSLITTIFYCLTPVILAQHSFTYSLNHYLVYLTPKTVIMNKFLTKAIIALAASEAVRAACTNPSVRKSWYVYF